MITLERFCILTYAMSSLPVLKSYLYYFWPVEPNLSNRPLLNLFAHKSFIKAGFTRRKLLDEENVRDEYIKHRIDSPAASRKIELT